ncbi:FMN-dependent NADH-azoreductase [Cryptosporangium aurantiacum]|uniref:FMN dependent NADH:quinone oxidoreductase n=1 Tax=Cryptosporangium aurantiacum TaxID=134849 RepID=A0A1M7RIP9_9ACTN|nr:NAD(P)H-dependent oxidoreductase [Cryptosporangium aurantiacum]SHN46021.1 FMN-dependent NADH-azoreductase [Cryptosporangium aurantiacum]
MTLFRLDASIRTQGSVSRAVADTVQAAWQAEHPDARIVRRDLASDLLPASTWATAVSAGMTPAEERTPAQHGAVAMASSLADELLAADAYLFAIPLYNYAIPHHVKSWIDTLLTTPAFGPGATPAVAGRPAVLVTVRGGGYGPGTPREGWDHNTPYLRRVFADMWNLDLEIVEAELTLAEVNPAMAELRPLAAESLEAAHLSAAETGRTLAARLSTPAA